MFGAPQGLQPSPPAGGGRAKGFIRDRGVRPLFPIHNIKASLQKGGGVWQPRGRPRRGGPVLTVSTGGDVHPERILETVMVLTDSIPGPASGVAGLKIVQGFGLRW